VEEIKIIGSGVAGLCVAKELIKKGLKVTILDKADNPGPQSCSWWAGGMLAPWCEGESTEKIIVKLGEESIPWWNENVEGVVKKGSLVVALSRDEPDLKRFGRRTDNYINLNSEEIGNLEPDLKGRFNKGLYFKNEAHLSPRITLDCLKKNLVLEGVKFEKKEFNFHTDIKKEQGLIIDCRGLEAKETQLDLRGVKGEMLIIDCPEINLTRPIRLLHPRIPLYIVPRGNGVYMLGATMIESDDSKNITARSLMELLNAAYAINPIFGEAKIIEIGVDARPSYPNNIPSIRQKDNIISVNGLFRHGFLLAPALARMVSELIYDNKTPEIMSEYNN
jgi:glycine oxidase